jgi:molybdopterin synthase catalytic subunit
VSKSAAARVRIQHEDFEVAREVAALREGDARVGAVASFIGTVRERSGGTGSNQPADTTRMELEHYPGMTEASIEAMIDAAMQRFSILGARVVHRVGPLDPGEQIVLVVVASSHRGDAFAACEFLMDYLKTQAPFWKKEHRPDGSAEWIDARVADDAAAERWGLASSNAAADLPTR